MAGSAWAEPASWTLSLQLPNANTVGLWNVNSERAWGMEFYRSGYNVQNIEGPEDFKPYRRSDDSLIEANDSQQLFAEFAFTFQDFRRTRKDVAPFIFYRLEGEVNRIRWPYEDIKSRTRVHWWATAQVGFGGEWKPWERVGFWVYQGVHVTLNRIDKGSVQVQGVVYKFRQHVSDVAISFPWAAVFFMF